MLCYVLSENAGSQEKMLLQKCHWRHFVLLASSNPLRQLAAPTGESILCNISLQTVCNELGFKILNAHGLYHL